MPTNRRLAAIMFTDIEGYTLVMNSDEEKGVALRNRHRKTFELTTEAYNGEIVQYFGDGTLSIFKSTVEAVDCAIELQSAFLQEPVLPVRIGIHVGDILHTKDDIIGDAVNIASRIESCGKAGSVLISDKVRDQIRSHKHIKTAFLDAYELKNVEDAMPIYAVSNPPLIIPTKEEIKGKFKSILGQNESNSKRNYKSISIISSILLVLVLAFTYFNYFKPSHQPTDNSIAVLPFDNLSTDNDAEIFGDGMTEDILTYLSKLKDLHVISSTSVMRYKNSMKSIPEIAKELGVTYILDGSIRKQGDQVLVTVQLIDAINDENIWAEKYDKTITDIFKIQSQVSQEIVQTLELNINFEELQSLKVIPTENISAYKLFLEGKKEADKRSKESIAKSIELYKEAINLDSNYAEAYAEIANSIYLETYYSGRDLGEATNLAYDYLSKAEKINDKISRIYSVKGLIYNIEGKYEDADNAFQRAIQLSPNDVTARHQYSTFFYYSRQYEKQLEQAKVAYKLDPLSFVIANSYATALAYNHKYDEAEKLMKKIEKLGDENNQFVINRTYFRLYIDQQKYKECIEPLKKLVKTENVYNRFLGYCYAKIGDTLEAYATIDTIRKHVNEFERNHQLAVVYSGLQVTDSVYYYLDTIRNKHSRGVKRESTEFFSYLKDDPMFIEILKTHGIE